LSHVSLLWQAAPVHCGSSSQSLTGMVLSQSRENKGVERRCKEHSSTIPGGKCFRMLVSIGLQAIWRRCGSIPRFFLPVKIIY
jgi:hypothetical protein